MSRDENLRAGAGAADVWGELPEGWIWCPLSEAVEFTSKPRGLDLEHSKVPFVEMASIYENGERRCEYELRTLQEIRSGTFFTPGDILLAKITPCLENGKITLTDHIPGDFGYATTEVYTLRPNTPRLLTSHLYNCLSEPANRAELAARMTGTTGRKRLPKDVLSTLPIPLPPLAEQRAIAAVLDAVQRARRAAQDAAQALRTLKRSLMQHLFTYGPVPLNQAGRVTRVQTEVGEIPAHWEVVRLGEVADAKGGTSFPNRYQGERSGAYPFYKVSDMTLPGNETEMKAANNYVSETTRHALRARVFPPRSTIFPKVGGAVYTDKKRMLSKPSIVDNNVMAVSVHDSARCVPEFLYCWFLSVRLRSFSNPGPLPSITVATVESSWLPLPPLPEQRQIAAILDTVDRRIAAEEDRADALEALYRSLLHHLMTGRVRVDPQQILEETS
ncbi:MAG: restriction endonuclease subunit S [Anaerolineae bacterium]|jgi:type I restriction enzyme S subunit